MILKIKTLSDTLIGSGEGSAKIDIDVIFDEFGLPYIPSRRIKGILRNSAEEVCDILGIVDKSLIEQIFGSRGKIQGKIRIEMFRIPEYKDLITELKAAKEDNLIRNLINKDQIINYFTVIRQQTAIDENGVAQEHSLRTIRVIKPDFEFEGEIKEIVPLTDKEKALLYLSILNFRRIGTARNRGFGEIKCELEQIDIDNAKQAIDKIKGKNPSSICKKNGSKDEHQIFAKENIKDTNTKIKNLPFVIKTYSPVLISRQISEQNTINTKKYFTSTSIIGIFANEFIKKHNLGANAHENKTFRTFFLDDKLIFTPAFPYKNNKVFYPAPLFLEKEKRIFEEENMEIYNIIRKEPNSIETEPLGGFVLIQDENEKVYKYVPKTVFYFHNARKTLSGKNTKEEGTIFYYEAIAEGEEFKGNIIGNEQILNEFTKIFEKNFQAYAGRSRTAQYGKIKIILKDIEDTSSELEDDEFTLVVISPLILYNNNGYQEISEEIFKEYLYEFFGCNVKIEGSMVNVDFFENFMGKWKMKSPREIAFAPGSIFEIRVENCKDLKEKLRDLKNYGIGERRAQGFGRVEIYTDLNDEYILKTPAVKSEIKESSKDKTKLKEILEKIFMRELEKYSKYKGFEKAKDFRFKNRIPNHLIGRVEGILEGSKNISEWKQRINHLKDKQAGRKLKNVKLLKPLENFFVLDTLKKERDYNYFKFEDIANKINFILDTADHNWNLSKIYWYSFFRNLRLMKKKEGI